MENNENRTSMTFEEALQDPSLAHVHESLLYIDKTPFSKLMPIKHEMTMLDFVQMETNELFDENPDMPIVNVISSIFETMTNDVSSSLALKLTQKIIETWENLSNPVLKKKKAIETV